MDDLAKLVHEPSVLGIIAAALVGVIAMGVLLAQLANKAVDKITKNGFTRHDHDLLLANERHHAIEEQCLRKIATTSERQLELSDEHLKEFRAHVKHLEHLPRCPREEGPR